jgi:hypothetical protein
MPLVRTDVSEEHFASIIRVTRIGELGTTLAVTSNRSTLRRSTLLRNVGFYESHNIPEESTLHSHRRKNLHFILLFKNYVIAVFSMRKRTITPPVVAFNGNFTLQYLEIIRNPIHCSSGIRFEILRSLRRQCYILKSYEVATAGVMWFR